MNENKHPSLIVVFSLLSIFFILIAVLNIRGNIQSNTMYFGSYAEDGTMVYHPVIRIDVKYIVLQALTTLFWIGVLVLIYFSIRKRDRRMAEEREKEEEEQIRRRAEERVIEEEEERRKEEEEEAEKRKQEERKRQMAEEMERWRVEAEKRKREAEEKEGVGEGKGE